MKRVLSVCLAAMLISAMLIPGSAVFASPARAATAQTYTVLVGADMTALDASLMQFFPAELTIHTGDTVLWKLNSMDIHTVTFHPGMPMPPLQVDAPPGSISPVMMNPMVAFPSLPQGGMYDGTTYANSGILGPEAGQGSSFQLTFTQSGTFSYICVVHEQPMSGVIHVVDASVQIPSPQQINAMANQQIAAGMAQVPGVLREARAKIVPPTENPDGSLNFTVNVGYMKGAVSLMRFFPDRLNVRPGDHITWNLTDDRYPHTVTFLNGADELPTVIPVPQPNGPPLLLFNPQVLFPSPTGDTLTRDGIFNSGIMQMAGPFPKSYSLTIGDISGKEEFICILHDAMGMDGTLNILPSSTSTLMSMALSGFPTAAVANAWHIYLPAAQKQ